MSRVRLPVSGIEVALRAPNGADDLFLIERPDRDMRAAVELLARVARGIDDAAVDWRALPLTDVDVALLELRRLVIGDHVRTAVRCTSAACGAPFDVSFRLSDYLKHHRPAATRAVAAADAGWFRLGDSEVAFRLPTAEDALAVSSESKPALVLASRCIRPSTLARGMRKRIEAAMQKMAPSLFDELDCSCHECGEPVPIAFDPVSYVLEELARRAAHVYEEVHLLARAYHWSEQEILALSHQRRARYAELAYAEGGR